MKKQVFKNKEKGVVGGVCYGIVKSLDLKWNWFEKFVLYLLRTFFVLSGFAIAGVVVYGILNYLMIDENNKEKIKKTGFFSKIRKSKTVSYLLAGSIVILMTVAMFSPGSDAPFGKRGIPCACIKTYLKENLKDPHSLDIIGSSDVVKVTDGKYVQRVEYRAKNAFGGYVVDAKDFYMEKEGHEWKVSYTY